MADHQKITLDDLTIELSVGIADWERAPGTTQPVRVRVEVWAPLGSEPPGEIGECLDYNRIYRYVAETWPGRGHVDLLETLADELIGFCLQAMPGISACRVTLAKPAVYGGAAVPSVTFYREAASPDA